MVHTPTLSWYAFSRQPERFDQLNTFSLVCIATSEPDIEYRVATVRTCSTSTKPRAPRLLLKGFEED
jgi:hypothetical protein